MPEPLYLVTAALCLGGALVVAPVWAPLVLAAWFADLLSPAVRRLERLLGGRRRGAAAVVVLLAVAVLLPLVGVVLAVISAAVELVHQMRAAVAGQGSLAGTLLGGDSGGAPQSMKDWANLASKYGENAWSVATDVARASATATVGAFVFVLGLFAFSASGEQAYAWIERHLPLPREAIARFAGAFRETGRGLLVATGGTALAQGVVAAVAYSILGLGRALLLGALTAVAALVPVAGSALVWLPLAAELGVTRQFGRCAGVLVVGVVVHSIVDNFVRPLLARHGRLQLPMFVVLVSMIGGAAAFGPAGAILGPLITRMLVEGLSLTTEARTRRCKAAQGQEAPEDGARGSRADLTA
jgi:predicted PurR-regulated permease PerM